jgi:hypothetical protein
MLLLPIKTGGKIHAVDVVDETTTFCDHIQRKVLCALWGGENYVRKLT